MVWSATGTQLPYVIEGHLEEMELDLCFFSCFNFRLAFGSSWAFFCVSLLPLSFFPLSPIAVSPFVKMSYADNRCDSAPRLKIRGASGAYPSERRVTPGHVADSSAIVS